MGYISKIKLISALRKIISDYSIEIKDLKWLAGLETINKPEKKRIYELVKSFKEKGWDGLPILYSKAHHQAITGSHRIAAAKILLDDQDWEYSLDVEAINVDDYLDDYCEVHDCTIDDLPYNSLSDIFEGTDLEEIVKKNSEW